MKLNAKGLAWLIGTLGLLVGHISTSAAQVVNEFEPNPFGPDAVEQLVELKGFPGTGFAGTLVAVDCDTDFAQIDSSVPVSGTFDANGLLTVSIADLENPSFILLLVQGEPPPTGVSPIGILDSSNVLDAIGIPDAASDEARCSAGVIDPSLSGFRSFTYTGDEPKLAFRDGLTNSWYAINDPDMNQVFDINANAVAPTFFVEGNPLAASFGAVNPTTSTSGPRISEVEPNPTGSDQPNQSVELGGPAGADFFGAIVSVDCDTNALVIDRSFAVLDSFDANGLLTVSIPDLENPSFILLLVAGAAPSTAVSPVGLLDASNVLDAIGIPDIAADEAQCSPGAIDPSLNVFRSFTYTGDEPRLVFRDASIGAWYAINDPDRGQVLDIDANPVVAPFTGNPFVTSFGAINPTVNDVEPTFTPRKIHEIQGSGSTVTNDGEQVEVQAIVTGLFEDEGVLDGFFIQEEDSDADADASTSEGIFVFCGASCIPIAEGDLVTVQGTATDFFEMSQIDVTGGGSIVLDATSFPLPSATAITLPAAVRTDAADTYEAFEGMRVTFAQQLVVTEFFQLGRFGQVVLSEGDRLRQFTHASAPSVAGFAQHQEDIARRRIILDDLNNDQNFDDPVYHPRPDGFSVDNYFRGGDTVSNLTGVLHWSFAGAANSNAWRVRPTQSVPPVFTPVNTRTAAPDEVGGSFRVATLNVLNYFATIDESDNVCGPGSVPCRGAHSEAERLRQLDKIVAALSGMDADIVGLVELENDDNDATLASIVAELPGYDFVSTGFIGTDAIKVGIIYKTATAAPVGPFALLDSSVDPTFVDTRNRPVLIQTFEEIASGERFTIAVNHLKSKGAPCDADGDPNTNDGQGNCNLIRRNALVALANYLDTNPTGSADTDVLILGDLNTYAMEDPIKALEDRGYDNLVREFLGEDAYSFVFDGQWGYLDHALATASMSRQVTGVTVWHINADEVNLLDYNDEVLDENERSFEVKPSVNELYNADPYRASDHDPLIIGLEPGDPLAVSDLTARASSGRVQLNWSEVSGAIGYNVYRGTTSGGPYAPVAADAANLLYLDTDVTNGVEYFYVVRVTGEEGSELSQSNEASATPAARTRR